jgi:hypothetical protein
MSTTTTVPDTTTRPAVVLAPAAQPVSFKGTDSIALPLAGMTFVGTAILLVFARLRPRASA